MFQDPLQLMTIERWPELQAAFNADWPRSLPGYNVLETQMRWKKAGLDYGIKIYCPFGDVNNGFVAINEKTSTYDIIIQCPKDDTKSLENALRTTENIDWNRDLLKLPFAAQNVVSCVQRVIEEKGFVMDVTPMDVMFTFIIEKDSPLFEDVSLPPGLTFGMLTLDHVTLIDSYWPHHYATSFLYFQLLVDAKSGYGLFKDGELVTWMLIGECGNLTHLYTMEEHRKKGYADLIVKFITNETLKDKKRDVFAFCVQKNIGARKLYEKLGFKKSVDIFWLDMLKKSLNSDTVQS